MLDELNVKFTMSQGRQAVNDLALSVASDDKISAQSNASSGSSSRVFAIYIGITSYTGTPAYTNIQCDSADP